MPSKPNAQQLETVIAVTALKHCHLVAAEPQPDTLQPMRLAGTLRWPGHSSEGKRLARTQRGATSPRGMESRFALGSI